MWRATIDHPDATIPPGSVPSTNPANIGSGAIQQATVGSYDTTLFNDRVYYDASIDRLSQANLVPHLDNDLNAAGAQLVPFVQSNASTPFPSFRGGTSNDVSGALQPVDLDNGTNAYDYRPYAGLPVSGTNDVIYSMQTADVMGDSTPMEMPLLVIPGYRIVTEQEYDYPSRLSDLPSTPQVARPWDVTMGAWPWTGAKSAQQSPTASLPFMDGAGIPGAMPSPTGAGGPVYMVNELEPKPLTFRAVPSPWDVGTDGSYVDSGV